jgi:hypothetical protein
MANRLLSLIVLGLTTGVAISLRRQMQQRRANEPSAVKPMPVHTWEGEGGALPATGAQMGPDPAVIPAAGDARTEDAFSRGVN